MKKLFGTDGIRGIANVELTPELAFSVGKYAAYLLTKERMSKKNHIKMLIGKDTRVSGDMLELAIACGALSIGADVISLGIVPTPAIPHLIKHHDADVGVMISASHNPAEFNGIKLFDADGLKLSDEIEEEIEKLIAEKAELSGVESRPDKIGKYIIDSNAGDTYLQIILSKERMSLDGIRLGIDAANGSNYEIGPKLFRKLGAEVFTIGTDPNGFNINENCGSTNLKSLKELVTSKKLDIGIAFDGDADRVLAVDENGDLIDGDRIMLKLAVKMKREGTLNNDTLVVTQMSNMGLFKALEEFDIKIEKTAVGDRYVLENMLQNDHVIGGEQSGHIILKNFNNTGDGLYSAVKLLQIYKEEGKKASEITKCMKSYPQVLKNTVCPNHLKYNIAELDEVKTEISRVESELGGRGRVLLRASGTEPLVRVMLEGENFEEIERFSDELVAKIEDALKKVKNA